MGEAYEVRRPDDHQAAAFPRRFSYLISPEGKIARAYYVGDVTQHPADVLSDLAELSSVGAQGR